jgi:hypothetical protein
MKDEMMLPFEIIAKWNGLRKLFPNDKEDMLWVSHSKQKFLLTPLGFVDAIQNNYRLLHEDMERKIKQGEEALKFSEQQLMECKENFSTIDPNQNVGKKSRSVIKSILGHPGMTDKDKVDKITQYLEEKC